MEKEERSQKRSRRKTKAKQSFDTYHDNVNINTNNMFPLLLAALFTSQTNPNSQSLIKFCLNRLQFSSSPQQLKFLSNSILSLLPLLLRSRCADIACRTAEIVGEASLLSLEMNERIASDDEIVKALVSAVGSSKRRVLMAACDALLDISTTSLGRQRLLHFKALETLMFSFFQVLCIKDQKTAACVIQLFKDNGPSTLLHAAITLINACNIKKLEKIPKRLSETFLVFLKRLWAGDETLLGHNVASSRVDHLYLSNIRINNLAECIFRLSMDVDQFGFCFPSDVERRIFGSTGFATFLLQNWEASPTLVRSHSKSLIDNNDIFSSFADSLKCDKSFPTFLSSMLQNFVSCLPFSSDELDILNFLEEVRSELGYPIKYQQDIRVLKTEKLSKREVHFFCKSSDQCCTKTSHFLSLGDIMRCEQAFKEGYTIALRGIEFRFASIAAIADAMASLFGQPSVGVNMYLTPPNSQGLACHCDDHCVFVCQVFGTKEWTIFSQPNWQLPRLYDQLDSKQGHEVESSSTGCRKFILREGNILYIPRGFPHEACTNSERSSDSAKFSLHLTFGVEVEPPFEWEGFAHVALHYWSQSHEQLHKLIKPLSEPLVAMSLYIMHAAIEQMGGSDPTFRKACLVGGVTLPLDTNNWLYLSQKSIFNYVIDKINESSWYLQVLSCLEAAFKKQEDPFQRIRWLHVLIPEGDDSQGYGWNISPFRIEKLMPLYVQHKDEAEAVYMQMKSKFCGEAIFQDVIPSYKKVLEIYKRSRKQYMNGMLSLHGSPFLSS